MGLKTFLVQKVGRLIPDKMFLQIKYFQHFHKFVDFKNPQTFNEKLQWLKLYNRRPEYTTMVDKYASKKHAAEIIGEEYVIPCVGGPWKSVDEIEFDALPDKFVLKTNHDCGGVVICKDKATFDIKKAKEFLTQHLKRDYYITAREWPYKNVERCIFAEQFLEEKPGVEAIDYKVMCFDGVPKLIQMHLGRFSNHTQDYYDAQWNRQDIIQGCPKSDGVADKPEFLEEMLALSAKLSSNIPHVRIDWYYVQNRLFLGEITFFDASGFDPFEPEEWNDRIGSWIFLPQNHGKDE